MSANSNFDNSTIKLESYPGNIELIIQKDFEISSSKFD